MADNTPQEFHQTPTPKSEFNYLPSPPITPLYERSIKREDTEAPFSFDDIGEYTTSSDETAKVTRGRKPRRRPKSSVGRPRSTAKKLSVRRKLAAKGKIPKRIGGVKSTGFPIVKSRGTTSKNSKVKVKEEFSEATYQPPIAPATKKPTSPKCLKNSNVGGTKKISKGRTTNNSLSTTLHPTITKRKCQRKTFSNIGKICSSYYPSSHHVRPNAPGDRYFKGTP
jgi:hypothetical protein